MMKTNNTLSAIVSARSEYEVATFPGAITYVPIAISVWVRKQDSQQGIGCRRRTKKQDSCAKFILLLNCINCLTTGQTWHSGCASSCRSISDDLLTTLPQIIHASILFCIMLNAFRNSVHGIIHEN